MAKKAVSKSAAPKLLAGGNPQIAKGYGDARVQAYIAAIPPGWRKELCAALDAAITRAVPKVSKAVKWNSPFYGVEEGLWFLSFHVYTKYVQVGFFRGDDLKPPPPKVSKIAGVRYLDIHEGAFDERQFSAWVKQAAKLPGQKM